MGSLWGGTSDDLFGYTVSLSDKGDMLAVASLGHDEGGLINVGLIQVFRRQEANHQWEEHLNITGEKEYEYVGEDSLSFSGDGKRIMFGSYRASNFRGYAKLVEIDNRKVTKLVGENKGDEFGKRVSISKKGDRVAVAVDDYIRVFEVMKDGSFKKIGYDIWSFWPRIALSANGHILGIGEPYEKNKGRVRILKWDDSQWILIGEEIPGESDYDNFGYALDLSADGQRVLIGTYGSNYVKVYQYNGTSWEMIGQKLEGGSNDDDFFGQSVSLSNDGNRIVLGSIWFTSNGLKKRGRALVYQFHEKSWKQIGNDVLGEKALDLAGMSVSISGDGNYFALGIPQADTEDGYDVGSVIVYKIE